ncbi:MAG: GIY-YIG nuclease family protein [Paludibacteraceae bacterium]|nr:GIY-YIG nuclease family protein [Paludibacteraceae bacterium]
MDKKGVIYILTNPAFPTYVKIGYADDLEKRLKQLNSSEAVPFAFRVYATYEVEDRLTDKKLHSLIDQLNPELRSIDEFDGKKREREFFAMSAEEAYSIFECIAEISGTLSRLKKRTPEGHEIKDEELANQINKEVQRRKPIDLFEIGLKKGDILEFKENPSIKVTIEDSRHIKYEEEITSLSALAKKLKGFNHAVQGTLWFTYNGKLIDDIRTEKDIIND